MIADPQPRFVGDSPAAIEGSLADRRELAFVAMERTRMPMVVTDPRQADNPIVLANRAFLDMTGYTAAEVIGRNCRFMQGPETAPEAIALIREAIAERRELTIELVNYDKHGARFWNQLLLSPILDCDGALLYYFASQLDVTRRREAVRLEESEHRLLREVDHRAKNALALVQGIVRLSRADDPIDYSRSVQGRVDALARAHILLSDQHWGDVALERVIRAEIEPFGSRRLTLAGSDVALAPYQVQPLALLFHELLTNAALHGAMSVAGGTVAIDWRIATPDTLAIRWCERGAPSPRPDRNPGFGSIMIDAIVARQLGGTVLFDWAEDGLIVDISLPILTGPAQEPYR